MRNENYIKILATDISASNCLDNWVNSVASTGTCVKDPNMTSLSSGTSGWDIVNDCEINLITFTINGTKYQVEEGMTLVELCDSEYNIINADIKVTTVTGQYRESHVKTNTGAIYNSDTKEQDYNIIILNNNYVTKKLQLD